MTRAIAHIHWIVHAIAEKVIATNISTNTGYRIIRVDKAADSGVIIPVLEIVQPRLRVIDIPAVAEGVQLAQCVRHGAGGGQRTAPRVIGVRHHLRAAARVEVCRAEPARHTSAGRIARHYLGVQFL